MLRIHQKTNLLELRFKPAAFLSLLCAFKRHTACYRLSLTLTGQLGRLADYLHIMIRVEDVLSQQVILPTSSPQNTHSFLYVSTKSLHHPACVPVCLFILWAVDVIWMMLALSALTLFCPSILQSVCQISVCLPVRITITCFLPSPRTMNTEELDTGACWHLYRATWIHTQLAQLTNAYQSIYRITDKAPITGIAAICCEHRLNPSSVLEQPTTVCTV